MPPRTPLLHPESYFERSGFRVGPALVAVGSAALAVALALVGFGVLVSQRLTTAGYTDAASAVFDAVTTQLVAVLGALLLGWLLVAGILYALSRAVLSHAGGFGDTLVITGWGMAPTVLTTIIAFLALAVALGDVTTQSPQAFVETFRSNLEDLWWLRAGVSFIVAGWQTYLYANGLGVAFEVSGRPPYRLAGIVAYGMWVVSLA